MQIIYLKIRVLKAFTLFKCLLKATFKLELRTKEDTNYFEYRHEPNEQKIKIFTLFDSSKKEENQLV